MADPASYRPAAGEIPTRPGVYRFRDRDRRVIYVGKAKNLRARLSSYFQDPARLATKTRTMVFTAQAVEWTVVGSEVEAIQLEYSWIKEFRPRFNIMYRDDKSYPYLAVTMNEQFPRVQVMRGDKRPGVKYFGPFHPAKAIRETVDLMLRVFPVRTCSAGVFRRAQAQDRPCLLGYIGKCSAPCVGRISPSEHRALAQDFCDFMAGDAGRFIRELEKAMASAVEDLRYEDAARLRDDIAALKRVFERNAVVLAENTEADIYAFHSDELETAVQVFHVRQGRIRGQRGWVMERVEDVDDAAMVQQLLQQVYGDAADEDVIPHEVLVPVLPEEPEETAAWLSGRRGSRVHIRVPRRGDKAELMDTVRQNAEMALSLHKSRRTGDLTARSAALKELQEALELDEPLLRIECYDISHSQGTNVVGSMVVVEDGLPKKSDYRRFNVTGEAARDDTASLRDVLRRRFARLAAERAEGAPLTGQVEEGDDDGARRFSYPPSLVVVDGGPPQVAAAVAVLVELGLDDLPVVGLAKRLEEVWLPDDEFPLVLPRSSQGLYLLQRLRDESHRFAIAGHRKRRSKAMTESALDGVPGLGPAKRAALITHFGSVAKVRRAGVDRLTEVAGVGPKLAAAIDAALNPGTGDAALNPGTGRAEAAGSSSAGAEAGDADEEAGPSSAGAEAGADG
ncbi:excinuclease ABC subunit UvrC [Micrococcus lylae]|uniref:UvrABC system protein C n=1 Tax=Micrococcus lylae TaxID=1273 RepID=A0ABY2K1F9_9MICC|nr:excinuclease ABC subunit UvrC [Micrococcus lylae]TFI00833.1 excinuclease ABC subunit UvrC [Micrococcus lylae]